MKAEVQRSMAHECHCQKRPPDDIPTQYEEHCFTAIHTAGLQYQLLPLVTALTLRRKELDETAPYCFMTFLSFRARRALRAEIATLQSTIDEIHQRARDLGLPEDWNTSPSDMR